MNHSWSTHQGKHQSGATGSTRGLRATVVAVVGAVTLAFGMVASAQANVGLSTFEGGDGNLVVDTAGNTDWANAPHLTTGIDLSASKADDAFGQGTKEDNPAVTIVDGSIPPNKNDLTRFYTANETLAVNSHIMLYLAWERLVNIGNANLDFEINQAKQTGWTSTTTGPLTINRTAGDLLVTYDFGGSGTPTLGLLTWLTAAAGNTASQCFSSNTLPCWGQHVDLSGTNSEGAVNTGTVSEPYTGGSLTAGLFGEAAIDLTAAGVFNGSDCKAFGSMFTKSRSSSSFTAEIKDFIAPQGIQLTNCSTTTVTTPKLADGTTNVGTPIVGSSVTDSALVTVSPSTVVLNGGSVSFSICKFAIGTTTLCDGTTNVGTSVGSTAIPTTNTTNSATVVSPAYTVTDVGRYCWRGQYSGDLAKGIPAGNPDYSSTECFTVAKAGASLTTAQTLRPQDSVTLTATAGGVPSGTVTFKLYGPDNSTCSTAAGAGAPVVNQTKTLTVGTTTATAATDQTTFDVSTATASQYKWQITYSGDSTHNGITGACGNESFTATIANGSAETSAAG